LPQHQQRGGIDVATANHEVGRLVADAAVDARIEAEIGKQAIFRRHAGQHLR
jgi:hypothetical protein